MKHSVSVASRHPTSWLTGQPIHSTSLLFDNLTLSCVRCRYLVLISSCVFSLQESWIAAIPKNDYRSLEHAHWRSRHCRLCRLSSVHWRRNCFADHTITHTSGNSSIDTSLIRDIYCGPEVLFETCVTMQFVDGNDDDDKMAPNKTVVVV